jgi:hypothetical protein
MIGRDEAEPALQRVEEWLQRFADRDEMLGQRWLGLSEQVSGLR